MVGFINFHGFLGAQDLGKIQHCHLIILIINNTVKNIIEHACLPQGIMAFLRNLGLALLLPLT